MFEEGGVVVGVLCAVGAISATWVFFDALAIGARRGSVPGFVDMGPVGWSMSVLLLWVVALPLYLACRSTIRDPAEGAAAWRPSGRILVLLAGGWLAYMTAIFSAAMLASWDYPSEGDNIYCRLVWDPSGGGTGSFGLWPFGPTCTFVPASRSHPPGALWTFLFTFGLGAGALLVGAVLRRRPHTPDRSAAR